VFILKIIYKSLEQTTKSQQKVIKTGDGIFRSLYK